MAYLASIRDVCESSGICKIIPPKGWEPPCPLELGSLTFPVKVQKLHELLSGDTEKEQATFYEDYDRYLRSVGKQLSKWKYPQFQGQDVDIFPFYRAVQRRGGYAAVTEHKRWKEVAQALKVRASA
jgi:hypothetical protein